MRASGIYADIDIKEYHAEEGISASGISLILDCPRRYYQTYHVNRLNPKPVTDSLELGDQVHKLVLEPELFWKNFCVPFDAFDGNWVEVDLRTKEGKAKYKEMQAIADGRNVIRANDWISIKGMSEAIKSHPMWEVIKKGLIERSIFWDDGLLNTRLKSRPDIFNDKFIVDIKTTEKIKGFSKSIYQFGYHRQAAMQIDALRQIDGIIRKFHLLVVEKKSPFLTVCFCLDDESLEQGRLEYKRGANIYSECMFNNEWPGYEDFQDISLPRWAINEGEKYE